MNEENVKQKVFEFREHATIDNFMRMNSALREDGEGYVLETVADTDGSDVYFLCLDTKPEDKLIDEWKTLLNDFLSRFRFRDWMRAVSDLVICDGILFCVVFNGTNGRDVNCIPSFDNFLRTLKHIDGMSGVANATCLDAYIRNSNDTYAFLIGIIF